MKLIGVLASATQSAVEGGGQTWVVGGVFGLLAMVFGVAFKILLTAQQRSDTNATSDRSNLQAEIERLGKELETTRQQRDEYFLKWVEAERRTPTETAGEG